MALVALFNHRSGTTLAKILDFRIVPNSEETAR